MEWDDYRTKVTQWEIEQYLTKFRTANTQCELQMNDLVCAKHPIGGQGEHLYNRNIPIIWEICVDRCRFGFQD